MKLPGYLVAGLLGFALAACGGGGGDTGGTGGTGATGGGNTVAIGTATGATLEFNPKTATAPANTQVSLTFTNNSDSLPHNLVFQEGIQAKTSDQVAPGKNETISFTTPGAGDYKFVCTLHPGMEGTLTVQ